MGVRIGKGLCPHIPAGHAAIRCTRQNKRRRAAVHDVHQPLVGEKPDLHVWTSLRVGSVDRHLKADRPALFPAQRHAGEPKTAQIVRGRRLAVCSDRHRSDQAKETPVSIRPQRLTFTRRHIAAGRHQQHIAPAPEEAMVFHKKTETTSARPQHLIPQRIKGQRGGPFQRLPTKHLMLVPHLNTQHARVKIQIAGHARHRFGRMVDRDTASLRKHQTCDRTTVRVPRLAVERGPESVAPRTVCPLHQAKLGDTRHRRVKDDPHAHRRCHGFQRQRTRRSRGQYPVAHDSAFGWL